MAATYHLDMDQGADLVLNVTVQDAAGDAVDITGATVAMMMRKTERDNSTLFSVSTGGGDITIPVGTDGVIAVLVPGATTADITTSGVYDLKITYAGGTIERLLEGKITLKPAVTR